MPLKLGIKVNDLDNVATIFAKDVLGNTKVEVRDKKGQVEMIDVLSDIPYGHKISVVDIKPGDPIVKYGESIGAASRPIKKGEHVHVHNLESRRGRGDL